jgi:hypothetical protein
MAEQTLILKATMEAVFSAQESLRKLTDKLIKENRAIANEKEQDEFFKFLAYATLGLGADHEFCINLKESKGGFYRVQNVEYIARWLTYQKTNVIADFQIDSNMMIVPAPISVYWEALRNCLFKVFPHSLKCAAMMSKEQDITKSNGGYAFD